MEAFDAFLTWLFVGGALAFAHGFYARRLGRRFGVWFLITLATGLVPTLLLPILGKYPDGIRWKNCNHCATIIPAPATTCTHCNKTQARPLPGNDQ